MNDAAEAIRRQLVVEINAEPWSREALETKYGKVWDAEQIREEFVLTGFRAPLAVVYRKSDGVLGSLLFQHDPRFYFSFQPH